MGRSMDDAVWKTATNNPCKGNTCSSDCVSNDTIDIVCNDLALAGTVKAYLKSFGDHTCTVSQIPCNQIWVVAAKFDHVRDATQARINISLLPALQNRNIIALRSSTSFHLAVSITISLGLPLTPEALFFRLAQHGHIIYYAFESNIDGEAICLFAGSKIAQKFSDSVLQVGATMLKTATKLVRHSEVCHKILKQPFGNVQRSLFTKTAIEGYNVAPWLLRFSDSSLACSHRSQLWMNENQILPQPQVAGSVKAQSLVEPESTISLLHQTPHHLLSPPLTCEDNKTSFPTSNSSNSSIPEQLMRYPQVLHHDIIAAQSTSPEILKKFCSSFYNPIATPEIGDLYSTSIAGSRKSAKASYRDSCQSSSMKTTEPGVNKSRASYLSKIPPLKPDQIDFSIELLKETHKAYLTVMVRNIPNKMTYRGLKSFIDKTHAKCYDFLYLRMDWVSGNNAGYAFVNFINVESLVSFAETYRGNLWPNLQSLKRLDLSWARIQGKSALIHKFIKSGVMNMSSDYRPHIFVSNGPNIGDEEEFAEIGD